jgi:hypothetical protein
MRKLSFLFLAFYLFNNCQAYPQSPLPPSKPAPQTTKEVTLRVLNKVTGQTATLKTTLLKPIRFDHLIIRPRACLKKKLGLAHEVNWSFIEAWVQQPTYQPILTSTLSQVSPQNPTISLIFSSWLNSASPNFSHPDYGITIQDCQDVSVTSPKSSVESSPDHQKSAK